MPTRLARAANFVTALEAASRKNPGSWRPVASIGRAAGITDPAQLEQACAMLRAAGLIERQAGSGLVMLTEKGWADTAPAGMAVGCRS